ncbi:MAG: hypothetical protein A2145_02280 [candidate division Zixibacteria bacterium RBG_16_40_9]|nr:MAG: hypothetical protein A2145_02280 [candidate division Zixibacteria bacterium RBG_16_40_9]
MTDYRKFLRPDIVSRLSGLEIKARLVVEGFIAGLHRSPYHGFSVEFAEHRQYMPGDPIRNIDWKVYSRTDRFFVKEFEEETNLKAYLLVDTSGSMGYHSNGISKLEYSSYLCAALSYLMLQQRDSVGLVVFDQKIQKYIPPKSAATHLHVLLSELDKIQASQTTNVSSALHEMAERIKRRGLIILLSDLFDYPDKIMSGLKHFRHRKHEVIVFHILDPRERDFSFPQEAIFKDIETSEEILTSPWQIQKDYQARLQEWIEKYRLESRESLIDYVLLDTSIPFDQALFAYLSKRQRLF